METLWFRWLGVAGIELRVDEQTLLIDPYLTRVPFWRVWLGRVRPNRALISQKIRRSDFVLVTHAHWDHLLDVPDVLHNTGAVALGSPNTCQLLAACGVPAEQIREIEAGDRLTLGSFRVEVRPSEHVQVPGFGPGALSSNLRPPLRARDYRMDDCFGFLVSTAGRRLLTDPGERPQGAAPADVLFAKPDREEAYYSSLLHVVRPQVVLPIHWDDFFRPLSRPLRPSFKPPGSALLPLRRMDLAQFRRTIGRVSSRTGVFMPEIFRAYDLADLLLSLTHSVLLRSRLNTVQLTRS